MFDHTDQQQLFTQINWMLLSMIILQFYTANKIKAYSSGYSDLTH